MSMRDLYNNVLPVRALQVETITSSALNTTDDGTEIDLQGFNSAQVFVDFGDIDEMGGSPVGGSQIVINLAHADDDGSGSADTYANVELKDVIGPSSVSSGNLATLTTDVALYRFGYVGDKRFLRVTLTPTTLTNGGPVGIWVLKGNARHAPV